MSTAQIIETIRQLPFAEQQHIAHTILKDLCGYGCGYGARTGGIGMD